MDTDYTAEERSRKIETAQALYLSRLNAHAHERLIMLTKYEENWNARGARALCLVSLDTSMRFLEEANLGKYARETTVFMDTNGCVALAWVQPKPVEQVEIMFLGYCVELSYDNIVRRYPDVTRELFRAIENLTKR